MADFTDRNTVVWDVNVNGDTFTATPKAGGDGYINTSGAQINTDLKDVIVVWPVDADPTLTGDTTIIKPATAINAFIAKQKPTFTLKVKATPDATDANAASSSTETPPTPAPGNTAPPLSPPGNTGGGSNVGLILMVLGGAWLLFGKKSPLRKKRWFRGR